MSIVTYLVVADEILSENRDASKRDYLPDPLGSTVALLNSKQEKTDTFDYWPYGEIRMSSGASPTPFKFCGTLGYYSGGGGNVYVRTRFYSTRTSAWLTVDPLWPFEVAYSYADLNPTSRTDMYGLAAQSSCQSMMDSAKSSACLVFGSNVGRNCVLNCIKIHWKDKDQKRYDCLKAWCSSKNNVNILPSTDEGCCKGPDICGSTDAGMGSTCSVGVCEASCSGGSGCNSEAERRVTILHEALHCCESGPELQEDTENRSEATALCIRKCKIK